jgi:hypothetical protein
MKAPWSRGPPVRRIDDAPAKPRQRAVVSRLPCRISFAGRWRFRVFNVVDAFRRARIPGRSLFDRRPARRQRTRLSVVQPTTGEDHVSDNELELPLKAMLRCSQRGGGLHIIRTPTRTRSSRALSGKSREYRLNLTWYTSLEIGAYASRVGEKRCNHARPHRCQIGKLPAAFAAAVETQFRSQQLRSARSKA